MVIIIIIIIFSVIGSYVDSTELVISGTGFDGTVSSNNMVTIGGTECVVTSATDTEIRCDVGTGDAGTHDIIVNVADKGLAKHENQNHTFTYEFAIDSINPTSGGLGGEWPYHYFFQS